MDAKSGWRTDGGGACEDASRASLIHGFPAFFHHMRRSCVKILVSDRFHIDPPRQNRGKSGSPDLSPTKFTSQGQTQKTTKAFSSLLLPAIVHVGAPNVADLLPHHIPGAARESPDADRVLRLFVPTFLTGSKSLFSYRAWNNHLLELVRALHRPPLLSFSKEFVGAERQGWGIFLWENVAN